MKSPLHAAAFLILFLSFMHCALPGGGGGGGGSDAGDGGSDAGDAGEPHASPNSQWAWIPVEGSRCASGSTAGFGINPSDAGDELFIFLQGGGACWNQGTCVPSLLQYGPLCEYGTFCLVNAAGGQLPTASHVTEHDPFPRDGGGHFPSEIAQLARSKVFLRDNPRNPFREATFVYVPYCTGDLHAGDSTRSYPYQYGPFDPVATYTVHFAGGRNMELYLQRLAELRPNARRIWLTGSSAGGYGATLNFERVQRVFDQAEVHLLADSSPFLESPHWSQWRDTWSIPLPDGCGDCDAGLSRVMAHLAQTYPSRRLGLLAYERDRVIAWYFYAPPGLASYLDPPLGTYVSALGALESTYDAHENLRYFVLPGEGHVMWPGYGVLTADGGTTPAPPSRDGGTTLEAWIDAWATGAPGWTSAR